ncbi:hypothetical protein B484DRAFT_130171, partial [Ochromonadaceae sp. CCMP2298]
GVGVGVGVGGQTDAQWALQSLSPLPSPHPGRSPSPQPLPTDVPDTLSTETGVSDVALSDWPDSSTWAGTGTGTDTDASLPKELPYRRSPSHSRTHSPVPSPINSALQGSHPSPLVESALAEAESDKEEEWDDWEEEEEEEEDELLRAIKEAPLKTLGLNATEYLNRQQLHALMDLWRLLRGGVEILKHGKRGQPKLKTLLCDVNLTKLYWRAPGSRPDPEQDNQPEDFDYYPTLLPQGGAASVLANGVNTAPVGSNRGFFGTNFGGFGGFSDPKERVLFIRDILQVTDLCDSEVLQRSVNRGYLEPSYSSVVSVVLADRTLDFEVDEVSWGAIFHPLQILVNFYQVMVAAPRASLNLGAQRSYTFLTYDNAGGGSGGVLQSQQRTSLSNVYAQRQKGKKVRRSSVSFKEEDDSRRLL